MEEAQSVRGKLTLPGGKTENFTFEIETRSMQGIREAVEKLKETTGDSLTEKIVAASAEPRAKKTKTSS